MTSLSLATSPSTDVAAYDPFDPANLRLDQNFVEMSGAKRLITTIPVRKPNSQDFVRTHPAPEYRADVGIIELKEDREAYLLSPAIANAVKRESIPVTIYTSINRQGVLFLWPVKLPRADGKILGWHTTARSAAEYAMKHWCRVQADMSLGGYVTTEGPSTIPPPEWPDMPLKEMLRIAFHTRFIDSLDHAVLNRLRGID